MAVRVLWCTFLFEVLITYAHNYWWTLLFIAAHIEYNCQGAKFYNRVLECYDNNKIISSRINDRSGPEWVNYPCVLREIWLYFG